jgi:hypothetical protein
MLFVIQAFLPARFGWPRLAFGQGAPVASAGAETPDLRGSLRCEEIRMSRAAQGLAVASLICCSASAEQAQMGFPAWVGLYEQADIAWLENENRLGEVLSAFARTGHGNSMDLECHERP